MPVVLPQRLIVLGSLLWLIVVSPLFVESAAYRYVAPFIALIALHYYRKASVRPRTDWLGWLCMAWGTYVLVRFVAIFLMTLAHLIGASDWLYAYPLFFPILGVALLLYEPVLEKIVATIPVKRLGTPDEIGSMVAWLASDESGFATGADFSLNGGLHMG